MNVLFLFADQHNAEYTGYNGALTRTPALDALAREGTVFESAYTPCPMCAPARGSMFSGRYVYENRCWDNCFPYDGERMPGWAHYLWGKGVEMATIGKLDFAPGKDCGASSTFAPYERASYDVVSLFRKPPLLLRPKYHMVNNWDVSCREGGPRLEQNIAEEACRWIREDMPADRPWVLNVNFEKPHSPWHSRKDKFDYYRPRVELKEKYRQPESELNPVDREQSRHTCGYILDEEHVKDCHAAYHAIVEEHDENLGEVLQALKDAGVYDDTLIIYSADHGEMLRAHGAWEKSSMYEDSIRVPMIVKLPGCGAGERIQTPVSLLDIFPTICEALGEAQPPQFHGQSLLGLIRGTRTDHAPAFSESHANGRITGTFALRKGKWKLMHYEGYGELLFDLESDPQELHNLADCTDRLDVREALADLRRELTEGRDLAAITREAFAAQEQLKEEMEQSGRLEKELNKRGFHYDGNELFYLP